LILAFSLLGTGGFSSFPNANAHGNIDQSNLGDVNAGCGINDLLRPTQSFVPDDNILVAIEVALVHVNQAINEPVLVNVREGTRDGTILGSTTTHTGFPALGDAGFVHYDFPSQIQLNPGDLYFLEFLPTENVGPNPLAPG